jgi:hypothetical protein
MIARAVGAGVKLIPGPWVPALATTELTSACIRRDLVQGKDSVKFWTTSKRQRGARRFAVVCLMFILWLGTFALTVSPQLHRWLHEDAGSSTHACLITQLRQHTLLVGFAPAVAPPLVLIQTATAEFPEVQFLSSGDYRLSPSRAPPLISSIPVA